jgi:hypothetical protein
VLYQQPQPQWQPTPNKALWVVLGIVGGVLLLVAAGVVLLVNVLGATTNQARDLAGRFTDLMISGETDNAYENYFAPSLQKDLPKEDFIAYFQDLELDASCEPTYSNLDSYRIDGKKVVQVRGVLACDGKNIEFEYVFEGNDGLKMTNVWMEPEA